MIQPRILPQPQRFVAGFRKVMSISAFEPAVLWKKLIPRLSEITSRKGNHLVSMSVYDDHYFDAFDRAGTFEKWACVETHGAAKIPNDMETYVIPAGLYAVFDYKGRNTDTSIFNYIFTEWLPHSGYALDDRPHYEILGEKYRNNDPESEEEICVPVRRVR